MNATKQLGLTNTVIEMLKFENLTLRQQMEKVNFSVKSEYWSIAMMLENMLFWWAYYAFPKHHECVNP